MRSCRAVALDDNLLASLRFCLSYGPVEALAWANLGRLLVRGLSSVCRYGESLRIYARRKNGDDVPER